MGIGKINIWLSAVADPCGTLKGNEIVTILDCKGILEWPCGRYLAGEQWVPVPGGKYHNLPAKCGHLQVEVPPGTYWIMAGGVYEYGKLIHPNYATHVGIVVVGCDETACVKLYNPSVRLCWDWAMIGLKGLVTANPELKALADQVGELEKLGERILEGAKVQKQPIEEIAVAALKPTKKA